MITRRAGAPGVPGACGLPVPAAAGADIAGAPADGPAAAGASEATVGGWTGAAAAMGVSGCAVGMEGTGAATGGSGVADATTLAGTSGAWGAGAAGAATVPCGAGRTAALALCGAAAGGCAETGGGAITGPSGGRDAIAGACCCGVTGVVRGGGAVTIRGAVRGCGTIMRGAGFASAAGVAGAGGAATVAAGAAVFPVSGVAALPSRRAGEAVGGATATTGCPSLDAIPGRVALRGAACWVASCWRRSRIILATSPTLCACDQSIFGFDSSCRPADTPRPLRRYARTLSASSASIELECVFFSVTPTAVRASRISLLLTSSSRANSLIRTVLIRPRVDLTSHRSLVLHTKNS